MFENLNRKKIILFVLISITLGLFSFALYLSFSGGDDSSLPIPDAPVSDGSASNVCRYMGFVPNLSDSESREASAISTFREVGESITDVDLWELGIHGPQTGLAEAYVDHLDFFWVGGEWGNRSVFSSRNIRTKFNEILDKGIDMIFTLDSTNCESNDSCFMINEYLDEFGISLGQNPGPDVIDNQTREIEILTTADTYSNLQGVNSWNTATNGTRSFQFTGSGSRVSEVDRFICQFNAVDRFGNRNCIFGTLVMRNGGEIHLSGMQLFLGPLNDLVNENNPDVVRNGEALVDLLCAPKTIGQACGDGIVGTGEQCDDGNTNSNDGCSSSCQREVLRCNETNDGNRVIDFEETTGNSTDISTAYVENFGIQFGQGSRNRGEDSNGLGYNISTDHCATTLPSVVGTNSNRPSGFAFAPNDRVHPDFADQIGNRILTDDRLNNTNRPCSLFIDLIVPSEEFSFDLLDIDNPPNEIWEIIAYNYDGTEVFRQRYDTDDYPAGGYNPNANAVPPVTVSVSAPQGESISHIKLVPRAGHSFFGLGFDNFSPYCSDPDNVVVEPEITKEGEVDNVGQTSTIDYTIEVTNPDSTSAENITVVDTLDSELTIIGVTEMNPNGNYDETLGTITWDLGTINAGETTTITYQLEVQTDTIPLNESGEPEVENRAQVFVDGEPGDEIITETNIPTPLIEKISTNNNVGEDQTAITYQLTASNPSSTESIANVIVEDNLDPDIAPASVDSITQGGTYDGNRTITWNLGTLAPDESITLTYVVTYNNSDLVGPEGGLAEVNNTADIGIDEDEDGDLEDDEITDEDDENVTVPIDAVEVDLLNPNISKSSVDIQIGGSETSVDYVLTVNNPNDEEITNVQVTDIMDEAALTFTANNPTTNVSFDGDRTITWTNLTIPANNSITLTYTATFDNSVYLTDNGGTLGTIDNTAEVCFDEDGNASFSTEECQDTTHQVQVETDKDSFLNKSANISEDPNGTRVSYSIVVTNTGTLDLTDYIVVDTLPSEYQASWLDQTSINPSGTFDSENMTITWEIASISATDGNDSVTLTYDVVIPDNTFGTFTNTVIGGEDDDDNGILDPAEVDDEDSVTIVIQEEPNEDSPPDTIIITDPGELPDTSFGDNTQELVLILGGISLLSLGAYIYVNKNKYAIDGGGMFNKLTRKIFTSNEAFEERAIFDSERFRDKPRRQ